MRLERRFELEASRYDIFRFLAKPKNIERVYPQELGFRVYYDGMIHRGSEIIMEARLLGQRFRWKSIVTHLDEPNRFVDEAIDAPFRYWRHEHDIVEHDGRCIVIDRIEFKSMLPIFDLFAHKMISSILEYRNKMIMRLFNQYDGEIRYDDPTRLSIRDGTLLSLLMLAIGFILPTLLYDGSTGIIIGLISWLILWFFSHDLAHLLIGYISGVRFSYYYIGLSNLTNALRLKPSIRLLFIALGIKIDRESSTAGKKGFYAMYIAGPIASILLPLYTPIILYNSNIIASIILLTLSIINILFSIPLSSRHGCIMKARRVWKRS